MIIKKLSVTTVALILCAVMLVSCDSGAIIALKTDPVTDFATDPATYPITEPPTDPVTEPVTEPLTNPITEPVTEPVTEAPPEPEVISFLAVGDNVIHPNQYTEAATRAAGSGKAYDFLPMYAGIADRVAAADVAFINQEIMMSSLLKPSGWPTFNSPQQLGYDLQTLGFDVVNIATNHMMDTWTDGLLDTIRFFKNKLNVTMIGGYESVDDFNTIRVHECKGVKIAFVAFTYDTNNINPPADCELKIPYINDREIASQIAAAKKVGDVVIVSMHWGVENKFTPSNEQRRLAKLIADCGADIILGHHPHVLQPIEWINRNDGGKTLCIFSMSNLVGTMMRGYNMVGGLFCFDIKVSEGEVAVENVKVTPTLFYYNTSHENTGLYLLEDVTPEIAATHGTQSYSPSYLDSLNTLKSYVTNNIAREFLADSFLATCPD